MYYHVEQVYQHSQASGTAHAVLVYLAHRANESHECWPSQQTIADATNSGLRTVKRALKELCNMGEIEILEQGKGRGNHTRYRLNGANLALNGADMAPNKPGAPPEKVPNSAEKVPNSAINGANLSTYKRKGKEKETPTVYEARQKLEESPPPQEHHDRVYRMASAISRVAREAYGTGVNDKRYHDLAYTFLGYEYSPEEVKGFLEWWRRRHERGDKGFYEGFPTLTSVQNRIKDYIHELRNGSGAVEAQATSEYQEITYDTL